MCTAAYQPFPVLLLDRADVLTGVTSVRKGALALLLVLGAWADLIDRIAVSVGNRVITRSDIERQIRVIAFQNGVQPDFSSANRHAVANKMIEQKLIQRELESSRYPAPLPA